MCKESLLQKIFQRICNNSQLVKRVFSVSAILIHDTLQMVFPLSDAVINEAP